MAVVSTLFFLPTENTALNILPTFGTGLSDYHHLIYSMLKTTLKKEESKQFIYRDYKNFDNTNFQMDLESKLNNCPKKYENFGK